MTMFRDSTQPDLNGNGPDVSLTGRGGATDLQPAVGRGA